MKRIQLLYWLSTALVALLSVSAAIIYFTNAEIAATFTRFGFGDWFRVELGIAKLLGSLALLLPMVPMRVKEWAYAGFAITFLSATIVHVLMDGAAAAFAPLFLLGLLVVSYLALHRRSKVIEGVV